jgi:hypothetical protein
VGRQLSSGRKTSPAVFFGSSSRSMNKGNDTPGPSTYSAAVDSFGRSAVFTSAPTPRFGSSPRSDSRGRNDTPGPVYEYRDSLGGQVCVRVFAYLSLALAPAVPLSSVPVLSACSLFFGYRRWCPADHPPRTLCLAHSGGLCPNMKIHPRLRRTPWYRRSAIALWFPHGQRRRRTQCGRAEVDRAPLVAVIVVACF